MTSTVNEQGDRGQRKFGTWEYCKMCIVSMCTNRCITSQLHSGRRQNSQGGDDVEKEIIYYFNNDNYELANAFHSIPRTTIQHTIQNTTRPRPYPRSPSCPEVSIV